MNENIKQLQNTAGIRVVRTLMRGDENTEVKLMLTQTQLDKFAELMVQECFTKLTLYIDDQFVNDVELELKEHFGIK